MRRAGRCAPTRSRRSPSRARAWRPPSPRPSGAIVRRGAPCRFTIADVSVPGDLDGRLAALGYARSEDHVTMAKEVAADAAMPGDVELSSEPTPRVARRLPLGPERRPQGDRSGHPCRPADAAHLSRLPPGGLGRRLGPHHSGRRAGLRAVHGDASGRAAAGLRARRARAPSRHRLPPAAAATSICRPSAPTSPRLPSTRALASASPADTISARER